MRHSGFGISTTGPGHARLLPWVALLIMAGWCGRVQAQWITQTNALRAGWNSVFLHVDPSYATIDQLVAGDAGNPIEEIWYWQPTLSTDQFVESPQVPVTGGTQWAVWTRLAGPNSVLRRLTGNGAYLVRLGTNAVPYTWRVKGRPVLPTYRWTLTGLNFIGFPVPPNPAPITVPNFDTFLVPAPAFQQNAEIYRYPGGELGPTNPVRVLAPRSTTVRRDQAYWVRAGASYIQYFGPIYLEGSGASGIDFGDSQGQSTLRLRNLANVPVTITLRQVASEAPPAGQSNFLAAPSLLLRGAVNKTNLTFGYTNLGVGSQRWTLAAAGTVGSEVELVIGLNRSQLAGAPGSLYAGVLRFTDSLGLAQIDLAVSAKQSSVAGLWVGGAMVNAVNHSIKPYARATNAAQMAEVLARLQLAEGVGGYHYEREPGSGHIMVFGGPQTNRGSYLVDGPVKVDPGTVASPFPLRLILHHDGASARLLQKVFSGLGPGTNAILATRESLLHPGRLADARRISAVHLPVSDGNAGWPCSGSLQAGGALTATVPLDYDDHSSNPFLHTYHPDHDNLDPLYSNTRLARGQESFGITRQMTLTFTAPANDFNSLTRGSADLGGNYSEVVTIQGRGAQTRQYTVLGTFSLKRLSDIALLTTQ